MMRQFVYQNGQSRALEPDPYHFLEKLDSGECIYWSVFIIWCPAYSWEIVLQLDWEVKHTFFSKLPPPTSCSAVTAPKFPPQGWLALADKSVRLSEMCIHPFVCVREDTYPVFRNLYI